MSIPHSELILCNKYSFNMKLLVVLSVIAISYADKLDRTYLPPRNAATAGGSPGALTAPGIQSGPAFGQGLQSGSGSQQTAGFTQPGTSGFSQGPSGNAQPSTSNGFGNSNNGAFSGNGFGFAKAGPGAPSTSYDAAFESRIPSAPSGFGSSQPGVNQAGFSQPSGPFDQGFGQGGSGANVAQAYTPERAQASADRNAEILRYDNENNGESYRYSYETSNGISAEEAGEATNGVRAQGGYSYTGDDGVAYSVTYTADENGYQPQGEHLPTPHPIPEEILKSIEENARAAAAGTQEGAYRPEEYENESSVVVDAQQYNTGASNFNQPQAPSFGSAQDYQSGQEQAVNRPQSNQFSGNQDQFAQRRPSGASGQYGQESQRSSGQFNGKASTGSAQTTQGQGQTQGQAQGQANGYNYKQPQNAFGSNGLGQGPTTQYRPQTNGQGPTTYSAGSAGSGSNINQGASASPFDNGRASSSFGSSQPQSQGSNIPSENQAGRPSKQGQQYQPSFGSPQDSQNKPGNQPFGTTEQGNQYLTNQNTFGAINGASQGNQNSGPSIAQAVQPQYGSKIPIGSNVGLGQNSQSSSQFGRGSQYQQNGNQPAFGSNVGAKQGASQISGNQGSGLAGTRGSQPIQAPYQYNRPSQGFDSQPQRPSFNNAGAQGSNGGLQGIQRGTEQFGGPRQPPSFSPQEGYKY